MSPDAAGDVEPPPTPDYCSRAGAAALAEAIRAHWAAQGQAIDVWIEPAAGGAWSIRSSLVRGLPPATTAA
jgi:hypothetical protein